LLRCDLVELRRLWASLLAVVAVLAAAGLRLGGAQPWRCGLLDPDLGPSGPDSGRSSVEVVMVRWGCGGVVLQLLAGSREARRRPSSSRAGSGPLGAMGSPRPRRQAAVSNDTGMAWLRSAGQSGSFSGLGGLACLLARECGGRTGSVLGLAGVKRLLVVASLPCVGAGFSLWWHVRLLVPSCPLADCGADGRVGRNPDAVAGQRRRLRASLPS
jgi:hypothetical protein